MAPVNARQRLVQRLGTFLAVLVALVFAITLVVAAAARAQSTQGEPAFTVLVFSKTAGYRHGSIPAGIAAIRALGERHHFRVDASEDADMFADGRGPVHWSQRVGA